MFFRRTKRDPRGLESSVRLLVLWNLHQQGRINLYDTPRGELTKMARIFNVHRSTITRDYERLREAAAIARQVKVRL